MRIRVSVVFSALLLVVLSSTATTSYGATNETPIPVTSILDETGAFSAYGLPMQLATKLAIEDINSHGGVLGRQLKLTDLDSQSSQAKDVVLSRQVAASNAAVVMGGILSSTMEAMHPAFDRSNKLYFYNNLYGGGACDKDMFSTGLVPTQQLAGALKYLADKGLKKWYIMAADYSFGQFMAGWAQHYAKLYGATVVGGGPQFYALSDSDYSNVIPKIQASGADLIVAIMVGPAQMNFYKQWAATGLNKTTTVFTPTLGSGAEQVTLGEAGKGILVAFQFVPTVTDSTNDRFVQMWKKSGTKLVVTPNAETVWNAWHIWAAAANKAGSIDRNKVVHELETGNISYDSPAGPIYMDGPSHQLVTPMSLWRVNGKGSFDLVKVLTKRAEPTFIKSKCDLIKNPTLNTHFTPTP